MSDLKSDLLIQIQETPNPNAYKYILNKLVLSEGKATYSSLTEVENNPLGKAILSIPGVRQVHLFQNVITVTHSFDENPVEISEKVKESIEKNIDDHNPYQTQKDEKKLARANLSPELQKIESILDDTIRPGLQGDGGDITIIKFEDNKLYVIYEGACGTCPSSTTGTLMAIEGILREQYDPEIEVVPM